VKEQSDQVKSIILGALFFVAIIFMLLGSTIFFTSCTLNMIMTHTEGEASDVVDSDPSTKTNPDVQIHLPVLP